MAGCRFRSASVALQGSRRCLNVSYEKDGTVCDGQKVSQRPLTQPEKTSFICSERFRKNGWLRRARQSSHQGSTRSLLMHGFCLSGSERNCGSLPLQGVDLSVWLSRVGVPIR